MGQESGPQSGSAWYCGPYHVHLVRELLDRGYVILAPEYRGSTCYGKSMYEAVDYGGLEVDDVVACRDWAVEQMPFLNPGRIGIVGATR